ncbi:MAG: hypothetical protein L0Y61_09400, partial [Epsilonproteobacteria bacterium]|nr:hypothetical protein [Campylobacterota bacterium]
MFRWLIAGVIIVLIGYMFMILYFGYIKVPLLQYKDVPWLGQKIQDLKDSENLYKQDQNTQKKEGEVLYRQKIYIEARDTLKKVQRAMLKKKNPSDDDLSMLSTLESKHKLAEIKLHIVNDSLSTHHRRYMEKRKDMQTTIK